MRAQHQAIRFLASALAAAMVAVPGGAVANTDEGIEPPASYAGWDKDHVSWTCLAVHQVSLACRMYYKVKGRYPSRWGDVVAAGIYQAPLMGYNGEEINPDDGGLDFYGDVHYQLVGDGSSALVAELGYRSGMTTVYHRLKAADTYVNLFRRAADQGVDFWQGYLDDEPRMRQFAILGFIYRAAFVYKDLHGDFPLNLGELSAAGLAPVDANSINPVTGQQFQFTEAPGDIVYRYKIAKDGRGSFFDLYHLNKDGSRPMYGITY